MSDDSPRSHAEEFERLILGALRELRYRVVIEAVAPSGARVDALVTSRDGERSLLEMKWSDSRSFPLTILRQIAGTISGEARPDPHINILLFVSGNVTIEHKGLLRDEFGIKVLDRADITQFIKDTTFAEPVQKLFERGESTPSLTVLQRDLLVDSSLKTPASSKLVERLNELKSGPDDAKNYEQFCAEAIAYAFEGQLLDCKTQRRSEDGLNILDLTYRVRIGHPFWEGLARDFGARMITFECKNYSSEITPNQVYSTERYLTAAARRTVCFLLARTSPSASALLAASGALRESGKLLIFLNDDDVKKLLAAREAQLQATNSETADELADDDPTALLDRKIYDFLSSINR